MTTATPANTTPAAAPVNGRVIGLAHYAGRAVQETVLAPRGMTFPQAITLRAAVIAEKPVERDSLVGEVVDALKADPAEVRVVVEELIAEGLLAAEASLVRATEAGRSVQAEIVAETQPISARIYAGIPAADLATAGRVLTQVTERANAELAALSR
jgi:DNA-binding MarR family transcriptional regulator